jgi:hypothetical protein
MKKVILSLFAFLLVSTFTGCIDIFETIVFADNGGGHVQQKIDMSQMAAMMESLKGKDKDKKEGESEKEEESPSATGEEMAKDWERLKEIEGITNVRIQQDTVKMIYTVDYDFANESALNKAMSKNDEGTAKQKDLYSIGKSSITRSENSGMGDLTKSEDEETAEMMKTMLADMKFHLSISVPGKIKSVSNKKAVISDDNKTINLEASFAEMNEKKTSLAMKINFKD